MLLACFGMDVMFKFAGVSFPASWPAAYLILLFFGLLLFGWLLHTTRRIVAILDVLVLASPLLTYLLPTTALTEAADDTEAGWSLRWINVFFTPAFIVCHRARQLVALRRPRS
jgi:hypothetical protein